MCIYFAVRPNQINQIASKVENSIIVRSLIKVIKATLNGSRGTLIIRCILFEDRFVQTEQTTAGNKQHTTYFTHIILKLRV